MRDNETGWIEADITINGQPLTFAESMTLRVAISSFAMSLTSQDGRKLLGPIAAGYEQHLKTLHEYLFRMKP